MRGGGLAVRRVKGKDLAVQPVAIEEAVGLTQPLCVQFGLHLAYVKAAATRFRHFVCNRGRIGKDSCPFGLIDLVPLRARRRAERFAAWHAAARVRRVELATTRAAVADSKLIDADGVGTK